MLQTFDGLSLPSHLQRALLLDELGRTIAYAYTRCWAWRDLKPRIRSIWQDDEAEAVIARVTEMTLTEEEKSQLAKELEKLSISCEALHGIDRQRSDRRLIRLRRLLPAAVRSQQALVDLMHTRKIRREAAYKTLRDLGVAPEYVPDLLRAYELTDEQRVLHLLARSSRALVSVDPFWLLAELDEPYWQMRVVAELILQKDARALEARLYYPRAFIHAVGRVDAAEFAEHVDNIVRANLADFSLLDLAAWTYGKLGRKEGLMLIQSALAEELEREPIDRYFRIEAADPAASWG